MLDHINIHVSDYARSEAFHEHALAPLGAALVVAFGAPNRAVVRPFHDAALATNPLSSASIRVQ